MKLSTLRDYVESLGGTLKIVADVAGRRVDLSSIAGRSRHGSKVWADVVRKVWILRPLPSSPEEQVHIREPQLQHSTGSPASTRRVVIVA